MVTNDDLRKMQTKASTDMFKVLQKTRKPQKIKSLCYD